MLVVTLKLCLFDEDFFKRFIKTIYLKNCHKFYQMKLNKFYCSKNLSSGRKNILVLTHKKSAAYDLVEAGPIFYSLQAENFSASFSRFKTIKKIFFCLYFD